MIYNRYAGVRSFFMRGKFMRKLAYALAAPIVNGRYKKWCKTEPLFTQVEVETVNRCNGVCPFCPVNKHDDTRPYAMMSDELFHKIIDELGEMDYSATLSLFSNNEPFIDPNIIERAKYAKEHVPHAEIALYSNGTLITEEKLYAIIPYLDKLVIDNYTDDLSLTPSSVKINEICEKDPEINRKVTIALRKQNEVLYTRGGQAPNNDKRETFPMLCLLPFEQLIIRPDGKVSLCANDALGKMTLGDCNTQTIKELWYSKERRDIWNKLKGGRENLELCKYCDTFSM